MITINDAKRLVKRTILANIATDKKNLAITPLISGKHGIGKSQMIKSVADDIGGVCITVEGGTLKEGEITGLPYQYKDENGVIRFRFLPYYAIERIQNEEKRLFEEKHGHIDNADLLKGDENRYSMNDLTCKEKIELLRSKKIKPVIIFIDEINRTENTVYKELMNILLTRSVNGYEFPWWVFFVGAMNPSTLNSVYATNEMDPAQLDRFIKIKVSDNSKEWIKYANKVGINSSIVNFISENPKCLSDDSKSLDDEEKPTPSPRGWDMMDTILNSEPILRDFFTTEENDQKVVDKDMKDLLSAKLGASIATMYLASTKTVSKSVKAEDIFKDDEKLSKTGPKLKALSVPQLVKTSNDVVEYLKDNIDFMVLDKNTFEKNKKQLIAFVQLLDSSSRLLFAQNIVNSQTSSGDSLIDFLYEVFEKDLLSVLELSEKTRDLIDGKK